MHVPPSCASLGNKLGRIIFLKESYPRASRVFYKYIPEGIQYNIITSCDAYNENLYTVFLNSTKRDGSAGGRVDAYRNIYTSLNDGTR